MRRVYAPPPMSDGRLRVPVLALLAAFGVFLLVPVIQHVSAQQQKKLLLTRADTTQLAPPPSLDTPPPPPPPPETDEPPPPELADAPPVDIPVSVDLDIAVGTGGAMALGGLGSGADDGGASKALSAFDVSELDRPPELMASVNPVHPSELRKGRVEGRVTLVFVVTEEGRVEDLRVESSTRPEFEKPALDAVRRWKFRAGTKENRPVRTNVRQQIHFKIRS